MWDTLPLAPLKGFVFYPGKTSSEFESLWHPLGLTPYLFNVPALNKYMYEVCEAGNHKSTERMGGTPFMFNGKQGFIRGGTHLILYV